METPVRTSKKASWSEIVRIGVRWLGIGVVIFMLPCRICSQRSWYTIGSDCVAVLVLIVEQVIRVGMPIIGAWLLPKTSAVGWRLGNKLARNSPRFGAKKFARWTMYSRCSSLETALTMQPEAGHRANRPGWLRCIASSQNGPARSSTSESPNEKHRLHGPPPALRPRTNIAASI